MDLGGFYAGEATGSVILVTGVIGSTAAFLTGRAIAASWRSPWQAVAAMLPLAAAARFIHFALFQGQLLSLPSYASDFAFFVAVGLIAWRTAQAAQMVRQYPWLYARSGPLSWRKIGQEK